MVWARFVFPVRPLSERISGRLGGDLKSRRPDDNGFVGPRNERWAQVASASATRRGRQLPSEWDAGAELTHALSPAAFLARTPTV